MLISLASILPLELVDEPFDLLRFVAGYHAVPKIIIGEVASCGFGIGLFHEGLDCQRRAAVEF
jgi:hypothetical protein